MTASVIDAVTGVASACCGASESAAAATAAATTHRALELIDLGTRVLADPELIPEEVRFILNELIINIYML